MASGLIQFAFVLASGIINIMPNEVGAGQLVCNTTMVVMTPSPIQTRPAVAVAVAVSWNDLRVLGTTQTHAAWTRFTARLTAAASPAPSATARCVNERADLRRPLRDQLQIFTTGRVYRVKLCL
ncbi:hypothetical protein ACJJTC_019453 [Scirpophaga incertulas]